MKQENNEVLSMVMNIEKNFNFRPYTYTPPGSAVQLFEENSQGLKLMANRLIPPKASVYSVSWRLLYFQQNVDRKSVFSYNLQKVMRQPGYDQGAVMIIVDMGYSRALRREARFIGQGKDQILSNIKNFFCLRRGQNWGSLSV